VSLLCWPCSLSSKLDFDTKPRLSLITIRRDPADWSVFAWQLHPTTRTSRDVGVCMLGFVCRVRGKRLKSVDNVWLGCVLDSANMKHSAFGVNNRLAALYDQVLRQFDAKESSFDNGTEHICASDAPGGAISTKREPAGLALAYTKLEN